MRRRQGIATMAVATVVVLALLAVFAIALSHNQAQARRSLEHQAHQRAVLVSSLIDAVFQQQARIGLDARAALSKRHVAPSELNDELGSKRYAALIDSRGRIISHSRGFTAADRRDADPAGALRLLGADQQWAVGDIRHGSIVNIIARVDGARGERVLITGVPLSTMSGFANAELAKVPGITSQHQIIIDGQGVVVGSTVAGRAPGDVLASAQQRALRGGAGISNHAHHGSHWLDSVPLANTDWRLVVSVPVSEFFASVSGFHRWLPWIIFAAFGGVAIVALLLIQRSLQAAARIRRANALLTTTNAELGAAQASLQESNAALERSNDALERQARELVRSNAELDQFASIASHDLQEPLRKVRTFTERISETEAANLSERGADYLRRANASAERMQILIEDLLRFSRVSTQARPFASVDLAAVTADVLDDLSEQIQRTDAQVQVGPLPTINADASQMRQLIQNLISNALKFRREDVAPVVRIAATTDGGWVRMTVEDNGIGFDPQYARRIFRVFERLHGRGTYPGTGIGLALCRKIAERHGGTVVADSSGEGGAIFTVTMQTERTQAVSDAPPSDSPSREEPYVTA